MLLIHFFLKSSAIIKIPLDPNVWKSLSFFIKVCRIKHIEYIYILHKNVEYPNIHMGLSKNRGRKTPKSGRFIIMVPNPMNKWMIWCKKKLIFGNNHITLWLPTSLKNNDPKITHLKARSTTWWRPGLGGSTTWGSCCCGKRRQQKRPTKNGGKHTLFLFVGWFLFAMKLTKKNEKKNVRSLKLYKAFDPFVCFRLGFVEGFPFFYLRRSMFWGGFFSNDGSLRVESAFCLRGKRRWKFPLQCFSRCWMSWA